MNHGSLKKIVSLGILWLAFTPAFAQENGKQATLWYAGIQGGVPFGISQFSSFSASKAHAGFAVGLHGGYRFNSLFSLEAQAAWGSLRQGARDCCLDYWLGEDGNRYEAAVAGMNGWEYAALTDRVALQRYGVQFNFNVLGLLCAGSRWSLEISPLLAAVATKSTVQDLDGKNDLLKSDARWHLGAGGNLRAGYRLAENLVLGVYSGITCLTGKPMDALPDCRHGSDLVWESGVRLAWTFGKKAKACRVETIEKRKEDRQP